jgi:MtN3 and saliva related transmembrane protein
MEPMLEIIGLIAGVVTSFGFVPQLIKGFRTKKLNDISYFMPAVLATGMSIWVYYGFLIDSLAVITANSFAIGCNITLILMKKKYSK